MTSVSRTSRRRSRASIASAVSSARLKAEQEKVVLEARMKTLKRKQEIEMARLKLQLEEEELNLNTELNIVQANEKVLDSYEVQSSPFRFRDSNSDRQSNNDVSFVAKQNKHSDRVDQTNNGEYALNVNAHCFEPESYDKICSVQTHSKQSCLNSPCHSEVVPVPLHVNNQVHVAKLMSTVSTEV